MLRRMFAIAAVALGLAAAAPLHAQQPAPQQGPGRAWVRQGPGARAGVRRRIHRRHRQRMLHRRAAFRREQRLRMWRGMR